MKILFLTLYDRLHPSTRFRVFQFLPFLGKDVRYTVSPVIPERLFRRYYGSRNRLYRIAFIFLEVATRLKDICLSRGYDAVFVQKGLTQIKYRGITRLLFFFNRNVIFDFDDSVVFTDLIKFKRWPWKLVEDKQGIEKLIKAAKMVIAGNETLKGDVAGLNRNIRVIPTPVDTRRYAMNPARYGNKAEVNILWSGKQDGFADLQTAAAAIGRLAADHRIVLTVLADVWDPLLDQLFPGVPLRFEKWSVETERKAFSAADIGIMPQPDSVWHQRKCAYKALLYMSCGIPVVSSPIGIVPDFIREGQNGFTAATDADWFDKLRRLIVDGDLRERIGRAGRITIEEGFSLSKWGPVWADEVRSVADVT